MRSCFAHWLGHLIVKYTIRHIYEEFFLAGPVIYFGGPVIFFAGPVIYFGGPVISYGVD